jgi:uncharacterized protein (TIGR02391 family)
MSSSDKVLKLTFTPNTIEHLGVRMYSTIPPVVSELIANAYDADAKKIEVKLYDSGDKKIVVTDTGHGMSFDDINNHFLRIGRNRREEEGETTPGGRYVIGKKGLGKLSFFGIAHTIQVETIKDGLRNSFTLSWDKIVNSGGSDPTKEADYTPDLGVVNEKTDKPNGTSITLTDIQRISDFDPQKLAISLSKIFILDDDFEIIVTHNDGDPHPVTNDLRYDSLDKQFEWEVPADVGGPTDYLNDKKIKGRIIATAKPISPNTNMRGIMLFSRKKLVNLPEYFSDSTSSHFYSYITGWLEVDFIDEIKPDVIGTSRQSLDWRREETEELREKLRELIRWIERDWRNKRTESQNKNLKDKTGIDVAEWRSKVPQDVDASLAPVIEALRKESEHPEKEDEVIKGIQQLKELVPEYTYFHYRKLHPTLRGVVFDAYKNQDYFSAVFEGVKQYVEETKNKSGVSLTDRNLLENVFSDRSPVLSVTEGFVKPDGNPFETMTITNITEGHKQLVIAMWQAFRSPIAHQVVADLRDSGLYTEQDCLDALSLLSHLYYRLEKSTKLTP